MREGIALYDAKDYEGALRHFRRATELVPEANLPHRHAAKALEGLGQWEQAVTEYQEYLRIKADVSDAGAVRDRVEEIRRLYLFGKISFTRCSPSTEITIDGASAASLGLSLDRELPLSKGQHHVVLRAPDRVPREVDVVIAPNATATLECSLDRGVTITPPVSTAPAGDTTSKPPGPPSDDGQHKTPWYGRWYTWAGAGVLVVGGVIATILIANGSKSAPLPATEGGNHSFP